ncbi:MAG: hypothetical protein CMQ43_07915 [Gammaproteobacteria bacterium]|nr:hypothetical protein [Gammaproteobacteria bacterium]
MIDGRGWSDAADAAALPGHMGVYELADAAGRVLYIGCAGGRSRFGLRGEVCDALGRIDGASRFRVEVTTAYLTRHRELLMRHQAAHGGLPAANGPVPGLGRLSPG